MAVTSTLKQLREGAGDNLGLFIPATATNVTSNYVTITKLLDASPDADHIRDAFITKDGDVYRRIVSMSTSGVCTLTSALTGLVSDDAIGVYFLLTPEEMNNTGNEELQTLQYAHRESVALVANDNEYSLPTWVETRGQVLGVQFRYAPTGAPVLEEEAPSYQLQETDNALTIRLIHLPIDVGNINMILRLRRRYDALANDSATTTCPYTLAVRAFEVALIRRCVKKFGSENAKRLFGMEMILCEREYERLKWEHTPVAEPADLAQDFDWSGPDIPNEILYPSW